MGDIEIRTRTDAEADCLVRELERFAPKRRRHTVTVPVESTAATSDLFAVLGAIDACLRANNIPSVRVSLDGRAYMFAP